MRLSPSLAGAELSLTQRGARRVSRAAAAAVGLSDSDCTAEAMKLSSGTEATGLISRAEAPAGINGSDANNDECGQSPVKNGSSLSETSFNYINSIIGSGIISMPFAVRSSGVVLSSVCLLLVAIITDHSLVLLVESAEIAGVTTYQHMVGAAFGKPGFYLLSFLQFAYPLISMVSYNVVVGDTVTKVLVRLTGVGPDSVWARRDVIVALVTAFITLPLSLYRDIAKLAKVSFLSLVLVVFIVVTVFVRMEPMREIVPHVDEGWTLFDVTGLSKTLAIMAFAFMCHHNSLLLYASIEQTSLAKWKSVTHASVAACFVFIGGFAIGGYATFTWYTEGDVLNNYCWSDDLMNVSRMAFSVTILLTYPIECFVSREVIEVIVWGPRGLQDHNPKKAMMFHTAITLFLVTTTFFLSLSTACLANVLNFSGIVNAVPLAFVLPALGFCRLSDEPTFGRRKLAAAGIACFGIAICAVGITQMIFEGQEECVKDRPMPYCVRTNANTTRWMEN